MKKLFTKPFKLAPAKEDQQPPKPQSTLPATTHTTAALQPKFTLPPMPHPCPHEYLAILATTHGLLLRPRLPRGIHPESHVRIPWDKVSEIEEVLNDGEGDGWDWSESVVVYGIIGILNLFTGDLFPSSTTALMLIPSLSCEASHLLVISGRSEMGYGQLMRAPSFDSVLPVD